MEVLIPIITSWSLESMGDFTLIQNPSPKLNTRERGQERRENACEARVMERIHNCELKTHFSAIYGLIRRCSFELVSTKFELPSSQTWDHHLKNLHSNGLLKKKHSFEPQWDEFRMHAFGIVPFEWPKIHSNAHQTKTPVRTRMGWMFLE